jgi:hypothetical protein
MHRQVDRGDRPKQVVADKKKPTPKGWVFTVYWWRKSPYHPITCPWGLRQPKVKPRLADLGTQAITPLQQALVRGHRWRVLLTSGAVKTLNEIAAQEGVDKSYVIRMVNLTTLAPEIVEAILDDTLPDHLTLFDIAVDPPVFVRRSRNGYSDKYLWTRPAVCFRKTNAL